METTTQTIKRRSPQRRWRRRDGLEVCLGLARGYGRAAIAAATGWSEWTIRAHVRKDGLRAPETLDALVAMAAELEILKIVDALQAAEAGSPAQARLLLNLRTLARQFAWSPDAKEDDMKSLKQIREMSDEELAAYVESLVPGLETKADTELDEIGTGIPGHLSVSIDGETFPETAKRDELAKLALPGWPRGGQDTGGG